MSDKKPATKLVKQPPTEFPKMPVAKKPATRKPQKITYPRLFNAVEDLVTSAELTAESTIKDLYAALEAAIVKDARGK